ncbi:MAG: MMPL family transporter, partial [Candidatus Sericytochromatia bacterium]
MPTLFQRYCRALYHRRWPVLAGWLLVLGLAIGFLWLNPGENLETELAGATGTEAWKVREILSHDFDRRLGSSAALVLPEGIDTGKLQGLLRSRFPQIGSITQLESGTRHHLQLLGIEFRPECRLVDAQNLTGDIREVLRQWGKGPGVVPLMTGNTVFQYDAKVESRRDSRRGEAIALLLSLVVLVLNFGSLSAALLPLLMGTSSLVLLHALIKLCGWSENPVSRILSSLVGLALGIDYALFIVSRLREELPRRPLPEALSVSLSQAGRTILYSGLIMLCSLSALLMPDVSLSRTVMQHLLLVIVLSLGHAMLVMPALMALGSDWMSWPRWLSRRLGRADTYAAWKGFSTHVADHYRLYFVLSLLLLGALAWPVTRMRLWEPVQAVAPTGSESMRAYKQLVADHWGGELLPVVLVLKSPGMRVYDEAPLKRLYDLNKALAAQTAVQRVQSLVSGGRPLAEYQAFYGSIQAMGFLGAEQQLADLVNVRKGSDETLLYVYPRNPMAQEDTRQILRFARDYARMHPDFPLLAGGVVARVQDF